MKLNNIMVNPSTDFYQHRSYIQTILGTSPGVRSHQYADCVGFTEDPGGDFTSDQTDAYIMRIRRFLQSYKMKKDATSKKKVYTLNWKEKPVRYCLTFCAQASMNNTFIIFLN